ncbi:MAG: TetR/AcrR family transcriptional regulator C-terminal domain-containing protein [Gaiellaceae bacterium]
MPGSSGATRGHSSGPRGFRDYLAAQQKLGLVRSEVDPRQAAMSFAGVCLLSAYRRHMFGAAARRKLPPLDCAVSALVKLIEP